ncbi:MAG: hypothetical protein ACPLXP_02440 [Microgenomates group bacterium]
METVAIVRQRNQLTIPEKMRERFPWLKVGAAIKLVPLADSLLLKPHYKEEVDWGGILKRMKKVAEIGKKISLTKFILKDRLAH